MLIEVEQEDLLQELEVMGVTAGDDVLRKMKELCMFYRQNAEDLVAKWVAYSATKGIEIEPTVELLDQLERDELSQKVKTPSSSRKSKSFTPNQRAGSTPSRSNDEYEPLLESYGTPITTNKRLRTPENADAKFSNKATTPFASFEVSPLSSKSSPSIKYSSRSSSGEVICRFGVENDNWKTAGNTECHVAYYSKDLSLTARYCYMFEKLREYASVLNERIQTMGAFYQDQHNIEEWSDLHSIAQEETSIVGRICCDSEGKLNASSILLEGSWESSKGQTVQLDISSIPQYSFFPGQIIAGKGINAQGKRLVLKHVYEERKLPFAAKPPTPLQGNEPLQIVVAIGPFTTADTLSYEALSDLLKYVDEHKPHVCILVGPFVDSKHEEIEKGHFHQTYEEIFQERVEIMGAAVKGLNTKLVLVPSLRDIHHDFVYPIPPFVLRARNKSEKIFLAPDPCVLDINGVIVGVTSTDILFHLGKEEIICPPSLSDRLGRFCHHILNQHSFYPLYPPNEINVDYEQFEKYAELTVTPHIVILPSDLRNFIKDVDGCCCINPERLTKGLVGGSFARIMVMPTTEDSYVGSLIPNIRAEIVKI